METLALWFVSTLNAESLDSYVKVDLIQKINVLYSMINAKKWHGQN
jgi:hypothetical protein